MMRIHKVALEVNNAQATYLTKACGTARFAYNWALARWNEMYQAHLADPSAPKPSDPLLRRELNAIKRQMFPWMAEVTKCAPQEAIIDLGKAFSNFFAGRARYPRFHKKGTNDSFRVSSGFFAVDGKRLWLPLVGWLRLREPLRWPEAQLVSVTISKHRDRWFAAITCRLPDAIPAPHLSMTAVGIDVGVREYVTSDGDHIKVPAVYHHAERRLRRAQKALARKQPGSKNRGKARRQVVKIHGRVADIRANWLHQTTHALVKQYHIIGIEDLNVKGMVCNKSLAKVVLNAGFAEFRRQLTYKASETGVTLVVADRWYPSSRLCSVCGTKTKCLPLHIRQWCCETCGTSHQRDENAAANLKQYAVSSTVPACGEFSASAPPGPVPGGASSLDEAGTRHQLTISQ